MNTRKLWMCGLFFLFISLCTFACSQKVPVVKPDRKPVIESDKDIHPENDVSQGLAQEIGSSDELTTNQKLFRESYNHISLLEMACGYYHDAYNKMPEKLTDLLDGFILIWPVNVYNNSPIKVLESRLDPQNPYHIGNIYYERLNDHESNILYLGISEDSTSDLPVWEENKRVVYSDTANFLLNQDKLKGDPAIEYGRRINNYHSEERRRFGYKTNLRQEIVFLLNGVIARIGSLDDSLSEILLESKFYLSEKGLDALKAAIKSDNVHFSIGKYTDGQHVFYYCPVLNEKKELNCCRFDPNKGERGGIEYYVPCPDDDTKQIHIFSSENITGLSIPENLIITKDDVKR